MRIFISHATEDAHLLEELVAYIGSNKKELGIHDLAYSSARQEDPASADPYQDWFLWISRELARADVVLFLSTENSIDGFAAAELGAALQSKFTSEGSRRVYGLITHQGGFINPVLAKYRLQLVDLSAGPEFVIEKLQRIVNLARVPVDADVTSPYGGLDAVRPGLLFGRDSEVEAIVDAAKPGRVVLVYGPSGCGKSSILRAGVAPALRERGEVVLMTPSHPTIGIADMLIVDQGEELMTRAESSSAALAQIREHLVANRPVIVGVRSEFATELRSLLPDNLVERPIGFLDQRALPKVITEPAAQFGFWVEPDLTDLLVAETDSGTKLPMLAFALSSAWEKLHEPNEGGRFQKELEEKTLSLRVWERLKLSGSALSARGTTAILFDHAERTLIGDSDTDDEREQPELRTRLEQSADLKTLARLSTTSLPAARVALRTDLLREDEFETLMRFTEARLVNLRSTGLTSDETEGSRLLTSEESVGIRGHYFEATHDVLFEWPRLKAAIRTHAEETDKRVLVDKAASSFAEGNREALLSDELLGFVKSERLDEIDLVVNVIEDIQRRKATATRLTQLAKRAVGVAVAMTLVAILVLVLLRREAASANEAAAERLASQALEFIDEQRDLSALLAVAAQGRSSTPATRGAVLTAVAAPAGPIQYLYAETDGASAWRSFSLLDETHGIGIAGPTELEVRNLDTGDLSTIELSVGEIVIDEIVSTNNSVVSMVASPKGGVARSVLLTHDLQSDSTDRFDHHAGIQSVAVSGPWVAFGDVEGGVFTNVNGSSFTLLHTVSSDVDDVALSDNGTWLAATGFSDGVVAFRRSADSWGPRFELNVPAGIQELEFRPGEAGQLFAAGTQRDILAWNLDMGTTERRTFGSFGGTISHLQFSDDGARLFAAGRANTIAHWAFAEEVQRLPDISVENFPDRLTVGGPTHVSTTFNGVTTIWNLDPVRRRSVVPPEPNVRFVGGESEEILVESDGSVSLNGGPVGGPFPELRETKRGWSTPVGLVFEVGGEEQIDRPGTELFQLASGTLRELPVPAGGGARLSFVAVDVHDCSIAIVDEFGRVLSADICAPTIVWQPVGPLDDERISDSLDQIGRIAIAENGNIALVSREWVTEVSSDGRVQRHHEFTRASRSVPTAAIWIDDDRIAIGFDIGEDPIVVNFGADTSAELIAHFDAVWWISVNLETGRFLTAGQDGLLQLWDLKTLRPIGRPLIGAVRAIENDIEAEVRGIYFGGDGSTASVVHGTDVVRWDLDEANWRSDACALAGRGFTDSEMEAFGVASENTCEE